MRKLALAVVFGFGFFTAMFAGRAIAAEPTDQRVLVEQAQITFREFQAAPEMGWFRSALKDAKGVLIVPNMYKGGLIFGGSGGKGVYLTKDKLTGNWRGPAFYNMGSFTFGLQAGAEAAQVIILAMTDNAVKAMLSPQFKLGGDLTVAVGPVGAGASGNASYPPAAFVSFARAKGLFAGLTVEGAIVKSDGEANDAYYGRYVTPEGILISGEYIEPKASGLREEVEKAAKCC